MAFEPVLLRNIDLPDSHRLDVYRSRGGYRALEKALNQMKPAEVVEAVKASGLRGRGGAGFPCGVKWTFLPKDHPGPIYLCINADESEPCTFNNRVLMEKDPHQVLEGIILACYAIRAQVAYYYLRYEYGDSYRATEAAIQEAVSSQSAWPQHHGQGFSSRCVLPSWCGCLHLWRGDGADRKPRRQTGVATDQAAVSGRGRVLSVSRPSSITLRRWLA